MIDILGKNKLVLFVLVLLVVVGLWYALSGSTAKDNLLTTEDFTSPSSESDRDIVATLIELRSVALDGSIFSDLVFQSLTDFGSQIVPEPVGRTNPFAPLSGTGTSTVTLPPLRR